MRISHQHKLVFLAVPRTGSTTARRILDPHSDIKSVHVSKRTAEFPFFHHITAKELKAVFDERGWDWFAYHRFCVVRNPFDRVVSLYHHRQKTRSGGADDQSALRNLVRSVRYRLAPKQTFPEYVASLDPRKRLTTSLPAFLGDDDGRLLVDDVFALERLREDLPPYLARLGLTVDPESFPQLNASTGRRPYADYYDEATRRRVAELYAYEIERFGYTFEDT